MNQQVRVAGKLRQMKERNALSGCALREQRQAHRDILDLERQASAHEAFARAEQVRAALEQATRSRARSEGAKQVRAAVRIFAGLE